jgi:hypothetical protein
MIHREAGTGMRGCQVSRKVTKSSRSKHGWPQCIQSKFQTYLTYILCFLNCFFLRFLSLWPQLIIASRNCVPFPDTLSQGIFRPVVGHQTANATYPIATYIIKFYSRPFQAIFSFHVKQNRKPATFEDANMVLLFLLKDSLEQHNTVPYSCTKRHHVFLIRTHESE